MTTADTTDWLTEILYLPPWRDRYLTGLGPEYGPRKLSEYENEWARWGESFHSVPTKHATAGGLWDHDEEARVLTKKARAMSDRYDAEPMRRYVERHSADVPARELEVYVAFWVDGKSVAVAARVLGLNRKTVQELIRRLRRRMKDTSGR
jgi:DNA-directed RNA polymerase specialized sigma24 family protein